MVTASMSLMTYKEAMARGWQYVGIFGDEKTPNRLHSQFIANACEVADLPFDGDGNPVPEDRYALWVNPCAIAPCGCVEHAEEGWPCAHDIEKFVRLKMKILG